MTDADIHRSTPGYVYSVALHSSGQEEGTPDCSCPCHLANTPRGAKGWYCNACFAFLMYATISYPEREPAETVPYSHEQAIADGTANPRQYMTNIVDYYYLTAGNNLDDAFPNRHFKTSEAAQKAANELNAQDVIASLNLTPLAVTRRERLKTLGGTFRSIYGEGHPETRWPVEPGRYAVECYSERYGESFWETVESLNAVERDADRIYDLDEDCEVPFSVRVVFGAP